MKKRILSLILALVLVFGVAIVPSIGAEAAGKKTSLSLKNKSVKVTFVVAKKDRSKAASDLNKILGTTIKKNSKFVIVVNGKKYQAINKKGTIKVAGMSLKEFVETRGELTDKTELTIKANFRNILRLMKLSGKTATFKYEIKVGKASIKNAKVTKGKKLTFTGNNKKYTATLKNDGIILDGNHAKDAFVKNMIKAGVVGKATVK